MIAKPASNPCPKCNKDQRHTKGLRDCGECRGEGFVLSKMEYPPKSVGNIIVNSQVDLVQGVGTNKGVVNMGSRRIPRKPPRRHSMRPERTPRSPLMTSYEHMICDMYEDISEEEEWREEVVAQWKQNRHWLRRLIDWVFGTSYNFVDIPDSYFDETHLKEKIKGEQMATLGELFEGYEDIPEERRPSKTPHTIG